MRCSQSLHMNRDKEEMTRSSLKQSARSFSFSDLSSTRPWIFLCSQEEVTACDSSFSMLFVLSVQGTKPAAYPNNKESHWLLWQTTCYNGAGHTAGLHWLHLWNAMTMEQLEHVCYCYTAMRSGVRARVVNHLEAYCVSGLHLWLLLSCILCCTCLAPTIDINMQTWNLYESL